MSRQLYYKILSSHTYTDGWTALMRVASWGDTVILDELLKAGADVNAITNNGITALMQAANNGSIELLLKAGADVNTADFNGCTALMRAAGNGRL